MGFKMIYITESGELRPMTHKFKDVKELANEMILSVTLLYETVDRKPSSLTGVQWGWMTLDLNGAVSLQDPLFIHRMALMSSLDFGSTLDGEMRKSGKQLLLPPKENIPNPVQKEALISYVKKKYPQFGDSGSYTIEQSIQLERLKHTRMIEEIRQENLKRSN